jgi:hypothetical protein
VTGLFRRVGLPFVIAIFPALAASVWAADGPRPGLWKVTTHVVRDGVSSDPDTQSNCVTADQVKDPSKALMPPDSPDEKCTRTQYEWTGSKLKWSMVCSGRMALTGGGDLDFDSPEHYRGKITSTGSFSGHDFTSTIVLEGERVGDCPNPAP